MIRIKMKTTMAGPDGAVDKGLVIPVDADTADALVNGGYAEYVDKPAQAAETPETAHSVETADMRPSDTAEAAVVKPTRKPGRR